MALKLLPNPSKLDVNPAKYYTDCFLKFRKWTLHDTESSLSGETPLLVQESLTDFVDNYEEKIKTLSLQNTAWTPAHLAALLNDVNSLRLLVTEKKIDINAEYLPLYPVTPLICAAYAGGIECMDYILDNGGDQRRLPFELVYWTVKGGSAQCLAKVFSLNVCTPEHPLNLCSLITNEALGDSIKILHIILNYFPDSAFKENSAGETTVFLAAQKGLVKVLKKLIKYGVPVNKKNKSQLTAIHSAILHNTSDDIAVKCLKVLLENGAQLNYDDTEKTLLNHAATRGFSICVFELVKHGALITVETLAILNEKIPNFIPKHLDNLITLRGTSNSYSKTLVCIDLRFTGTINSTQPNLRETSFLNFLIQDGQNKFLSHPVVETFLIVKWIFVEKFFIASMLSHTLMLVFFSLFVLEEYVPGKTLTSSSTDTIYQNVSLHGSLHFSNKTQVFEAITTSSKKLVQTRALWYLSLITLLTRIWVNIFRCGLHPKTCALQLENWIQWIFLTGMTISHVPFRNEEAQHPEWQSTTAAVSVFMSWGFLLNYLRRQPTLGIYVEMLYKVILNLLKLMLTFASILIGFVISFMILYKGVCSKYRVPQKPGLKKVLEREKNMPELCLWVLVHVWVFRLLEVCFSKIQIVNSFCSFVHN